LEGASYEKKTTKSMCDELGYEDSMLAYVEEAAGLGGTRGRRRWVTGRAVEPATSRIPTSAGRRKGRPGRRRVGSHATSE
jgi:hypothetical protein